MKFQCPLCQTEMVESLGNSMHPGDAKFGVQVHCPAPQTVCKAQEVMGHGDNAKDAFKVVQEKFLTREERNGK